MPSNGDHWYDNDWGFYAFNYSADDVFSRTLFPGKAQKEQFFQQLYAMDYQNWWNSAPEQMKRAKEAGINPNTAAAGIAGTDGTASLPQVAAGAAPENPFDTIGNMVDSGMNVAKGVSDMNLNRANADAASAKADLDRANAGNVDRLADADVLDKAGKFALALTGAGLPEIEAMDIGLSTVRNGLDGVAALLKGDSVCRKIDYEINLIDAEYAKKWKEVENLEFENSLLEGKIEEQVYRTLIAKTEEEKQKLIKWREEQTNGLWKRFEGDPNFDLWQTMSNIRLKYGEDSPQYKALLKQAKDYIYQQELGRYTAEFEKSYEIAYNNALGNEEVKAFYDQYRNDLDMILEQFKHMLSIAYPETGDLYTAIFGLFNSLKAGILGVPFPQINSDGSIPSLVPKR